jgi:hypothetical protein
MVLPVVADSMKNASPFFMKLNAHRCSAGEIWWMRC